MIEIRFRHVERGLVISDKAQRFEHLEDLSAPGQEIALEDTIRRAFAQMSEEVIRQLRNGTYESSLNITTHNTYETVDPRLEGRNDYDSLNPYSPNFNPFRRHD